MNLKYYVPHGMFDLRRRGEKHLLCRIEPEALHTLADDALTREDSLILVSAAYPATEETPTLVPLDENNAISPIAEPHLRALFATSEEACGEKVLFTSTYRTLDFQRSIYGVNPFAAKPGESEHHSGLVADIKVDGYAQRRFILSKTGKWMAQNAHCFGFLIRYPLWGEKRTGVDYEPWHLRYVGAPHAELIYRSKITLEDYLALLETGAFYRFGDTVISRQIKAPFVMPASVHAATASLDTRGGSILWGKINSEEI